MRNLLLAGCIGLTAIAELPVASIAQANGEARAVGEHPAQVAVKADAASSTDSSRAYDSLALRLETSWFEDRIIRGLNGPVVGHIGMYRSVNLAPLVASSKNATREAREFNRNYGVATRAGVAGLVIFGVAYVAERVADPGNLGLIAATIGGGGLMFYGTVRMEKAYNSLSKAIWWYNRDLKRR